MASLSFHRSIIHVDMDCFYVSVERLLDPSLEGKPVAVGGSPDGRGVVASASYEARAFGVRSAMPANQALRLCPKLIFIRGSYTRYSDYSEKIFTIFSQFTPKVQMVSQDEAYLDLTGTERLYKTPIVAAQKLREAILAETKLPCSLGIASNRLVAKIASDLCKPRGLLWVPGGSEKNFLAPLPIGRIPGVGRKSEEKALSIGLKRIGDAARISPDRLRAHFGSFGDDLYAKANGIDETPVETREEVKSVGNEETFDEDSADVDFLHAIISMLSEKVAYRLRGKGLSGSTITLKYRYQGFETHTAARTLSVATDDETVILATAKGLLAEKWDSSRPLRLVGVSVSSLGGERQQLDLVDDARQKRNVQLHKALDRIRDRHGYGGIRRATGALNDDRDAEE